MVSVVAVLLANADGRSGRLLSELLARRCDRHRILFLFMAAFVVNAAVSAIGGTIADRMIGQGVLQLMLAFALASAAVTLLWQRQWGVGADRLAIASPPVMGLHMLHNQFGDRNQFLIGALAATSGAGAWAAAGGLAGWILAMVPVLAGGVLPMGSWGRQGLRWTAAAALAIWAALALRTAFGV